MKSSWQRNKREQFTAHARRKTVCTRRVPLRLMLSGAIQCMFCMTCCIAKTLQQALYSLQTSSSIVGTLPIRCGF